MAEIFLAFYICCQEKSLRRGNKGKEGEAIVKKGK